MDTRIEHLAIIIAERCEPMLKRPRGDSAGDKYKSILRHAQDILLLCAAYRAENPDEYE